MYTIWVLSSLVCVFTAPSMPVLKLENVANRSDDIRISTTTTQTATIMNPTDLVLNILFSNLIRWNCNIKQDNLERIKLISPRECAVRGECRVSDAEFTSASSDWVLGGAQFSLFIPEFLWGFAEMLFEAVAEVV